MVDLLVQRARTSSKKELAVLSQSLGVNHSPTSLLFDQRLREVFGPVSGALWDWMHCLVSGGLANLELQLLLCAMRNEGITCSRLDEFLGSFRGLKSFPSGKLPADFVQSRFKHDSDMFKAFASELLDLLPLIRAFLEMVLRPTGKLPLHTQSCVQLCSMLDILTLGDTAVSYRATLKGIVEEHHRLFVLAYGRDCVIPKYHYVMHIPEVLGKLQINMSCFVTERKHRMTKALAAHTFGNFELALTRGLVAKQAEGMVADVNLFEPTYLQKAVDGGWALPHFQSVLPSATAVHTASAIVLEIGSVKRNDFVYLRSEGASMVGSILRFFRVAGASDDQFFGHLEIYRHLQGSEWSSKGATDMLLPCACIVSKLVYAHLGDGRIKIVEPALLRVEGIPK